MRTLKRWTANLWDSHIMISGAFLNEGLLDDLVSAAWGPRPIRWQVQLQHVLPQRGIWNLQGPPSCQSLRNTCTYTYVNFLYTSSTLHYITLQYSTVQYVRICMYIYITFTLTFTFTCTLHYITLNRIQLTLHDVALHYITLHYITLRYVTFDTSLHEYSIAL